MGSSRRRVSTPSLRDEDDDLLRAAEELGIDLSGVRAPTGELGSEVVPDEAEAEVSAEGEAEAESEKDEDLDGAIDVESLIEEGISLDPLEGVEEVPVEDPVQETET